MDTPPTVRFDPASGLAGEITPPADKSISHRAAIFGAMGSSPVRVRNYLVAADTTSSLNAVRALGASVDASPDGGVLTIRGVGLRGARVPDAPIDVGNAGTLMRLLPGWLAAQDGRAFVLDARAESADRVERGGRVGRDEVVAHADGRVAHRAEDRRPVGDRLVRGRRQLALEAGRGVEADGRVRGHVRRSPGSRGRTGAPPRAPRRPRRPTGRSRRG